MSNNVLGVSTICWFTKVRVCVISRAVSVLESAVVGTNHTFGTVVFFTLLAVLAITA
jgi:hypothetical protein